MNPKEMSRRSSLKAGAGLLLAFGARSVLASIAGCTSRVAAIKGNDLYSITRDAIDAVGGMSSIVQRGERVLIKANMIEPGSASRGSVSKTEVLIATAEECLKAGASTVVIGDGGQNIVFSWDKHRTLDLSKTIVQEAARLNGNPNYAGKVILSCLDNDYPSNLAIPSPTNTNGELYISSIYKSIDRIISVAVAKTHKWSQLTLAGKNFVGVISHEKYSKKILGVLNRSGISHESAEAIADSFLDVVAYKKPDLAIIDFSVCLEGNGPSSYLGGRTVNVKDRLGAWMVLASKDIMAADATAARVMSHDVGNVVQLKKGHARGLGEIDGESIEILGSRLGDIIMPWEPAKMSVPIYAAGNRTNGSPLNPK